MAADKVFEATASPSGPASPGCEWYSVEGIIYDRHGGREIEGHPLASAAWLSVLNPAVDAVARVALTVYHERREPTEHVFSAPPGRSTRLDLHDLPEIGPRNQQFALRLFADRPIFPQHTWSDYRPLRPIPEDMESITLFPGPLGEPHRHWIFPDMYQGMDDERVWYEKEMLTLLNPGDVDSAVETTFYDGFWLGVKNYRAAAYERPVRLTVPARRVLAVRLFDLVEVPRHGTGNVRPGGAHGFNMQRALRLECSAPIVPQKTRRCQVHFDDTIIGEWTSIGHVAAEGV
jgi:hypothetical protein